MTKLGSSEGLLLTAASSAKLQGFLQEPVVARVDPQGPIAGAQPSARR